MTPALRIAKRRGVPVATIMASPQNGKGYDAQCEYIQQLWDSGLDAATIAVFFDKTEGWVARRLKREIAA